MQPGHAMLTADRELARGHAHRLFSHVDAYGDHETRPVCVALNVLLAGHPPSTIGSR
jgi:hypothetical protein